MIYRLLTSVVSLESQPIPSFLFSENQVSLQIEPQDLSPVHMSGKSSQLKRKRNEDKEEDIALFRRVRIETSLFLPAKDSRPKSPVSTSSAASVWSDVASQNSEDEEESLHFSQLAGTDRTRNMRGAAAAAQQRMANLRRSETPEAIHDPDDTDRMVVETVETQPSDVYDCDDVSLRDSPPLRAMRVDLMPSPSPPPHFALSRSPSTRIYRKYEYFV